MAGKEKERMKEKTKECLRWSPVRLMRIKLILEGDQMNIPHKYTILLISSLPETDEEDLTNWNKHV